MASRFNTVQQIPGYQGLPLDLLLKAGMAKDNSIQDSYDKIQANIDKTGGIETYYAHDTQRKNQMLSEMQSKIQALGSKDFSSPETEHQINDIINTYSNNPEVTAWQVNTQNAKESGKLIDEQNKSGKYHAPNWNPYTQQVNTYNSQDVNSPSKVLNSSPYYGLGKQDELGFYKDIVDITGDSYQGIKTDDYGNWVSLDGKSADRLQQQAYNLLPADLQTEWENNYDSGLVNTKTYPTKDSYINDKLLTFANSAATHNAKYLNPDNLNQPNSSGTGTTKSGKTPLPNAWLRDVVNPDLNTITNTNLKNIGLYPFDEKTGQFTIPIKGSYMDLATPLKVANKEDEKILHLGMEYNSIKDHPKDIWNKLTFEEKKKLVPSLTEDQPYDYFHLTSNKTGLVSKDIDTLLLKPIIENAKQNGIDLTNSSFNSKYQSLLGKASTDDIDALGQIIPLDGTAKFTLKDSDNKINVDDGEGGKIIVSGSIELGEQELKDKLSTTHSSLDGLLKSGLITKHIKYDDNGDEHTFYEIPVNKPIANSRTINQQYNQNTYGQNDYNDNSENFNNSYDEYNLNQLNTQGVKTFESNRNENLGKLYQDINNIKDPESKKLALEEWHNTFDNHPDIKEKDKRLYQLQQEVTQEHQKPGYMKNRVGSKPSTTTNTNNIKGDTLAIRNNNPGNIRDNSGRFIKYNSMKEGLNGLKDYVQRAITGKHQAYKPNESLLEFAKTYSPKSDGNDPVAKANSIAKDLGISPDTPIKDLGDKLDQFVQAIIKTEDINLYNQLYSS